MKSKRLLTTLVTTVNVAAWTLVLLVALALADPLNCPPLTPTNVYAIPGSTPDQILVTWEMTEDVNCPIMYFKLISEPESEIDLDTIPSKDREAMPKGFTEGVKYTFTVVAFDQNDKEIGRSEKSDIITFGIPGAPTITASELSDNHVTIFWDIPKNQGATPITQYFASAVDPFTGDIKFSKGIHRRESQTTFENLEPEADYYFTVRAANDIGQSLDSDPTENIRMPIAEIQNSSGDSFLSSGEATTTIGLIAGAPSGPEGGRQDLGPQQISSTGSNPGPEGGKGESSSSLFIIIGIGLASFLVGGTAVFGLMKTKYMVSGRAGHDLKSNQWLNEKLKTGTTNLSEKLKGLNSLQAVNKRQRDSRRGSTRNIDSEPSEYFEQVLSVVKPIFEEAIEYSTLANMAGKGLVTLEELRQDVDRLQNEKLELEAFNEDLKKKQANLSQSLSLINSKLDLEQQDQRLKEFAEHLFKSLGLAFIGIKEDFMEKEAFPKKAAAILRNSAIITDIDLTKIAQPDRNSRIFLRPQSNGKLSVIIPSLGNPNDINEVFTNLLGGIFAQIIDPERWHSPLRISNEQDRQWNQIRTKLQNFHATYEQGAAPGIAFVLGHLMDRAQTSLSDLAARTYASEQSDGRRDPMQQEMIRTFQATISYVEIFLSEQFSLKYQEQLQRGLARHLRDNVQKSDVQRLIERHIATDSLEVLMTSVIERRSGWSEVLKIAKELAGLRAQLPEYLWEFYVAKLADSRDENLSRIPGLQIAYVLYAGTLGDYLERYSDTFKVL